jgi:hypothetical protein
LPTRNKNQRILQAFVDYLNGILNQTVTDSRLSVIRINPPYFAVTRLQGKEIRPLELAPKGWLHFRLIAIVRPDDRIIVEEATWSYSLSPNPDEEQWIFRYDYRLNPQDNYPCAHIHINAGNLKELHFPTSRVSIEQIVAHLITEHGIKPRCENWLDLLKTSHEGFVERRTDLEASPFP